VGRWEFKTWRRSRRRRRRRKRRNGVQILMEVVEEHCGVMEMP
jgi:hypothetical protein